MASIIVFDACVLHPAPVRDLLLRIAEAGLIQAKFSDDILDETFASILARRPDLSPERLARTRQMMCDALDDCLVTGYAGLADHIELPDEGDRHVVAAAIRCGAQAIVTTNVRDFPARALRPLELVAIHPDTFVLDLLDRAAEKVMAVVQAQTAALKNPPRARTDVLDMLTQCGLIQTSIELRRLYGLGG
ncbi:PIN domain-containing protein [Myxococcota bacterium]|nr:PIN domain-containing protein [Myxococcota bacterium]